jgi:hypothetical protein
MFMEEEIEMDLQLYSESNLKTEAEDFSETLAAI